MKSRLESAWNLVCVREEQTRKLTQTRAAQQQTPWYRLKQRSYWRSQIHRLEQQLDSSDGQVNEEDVRRIAMHAAHLLWSRAAEEVVPNKNRYGHAAAAQFDVILSKAMAGRDDLMPFVSGRRPAKLIEVPVVHQVVIKEFIATEARKTMAGLAAVAASPTLLHERYRNMDGNTVITIQHVESGLRALFTLTDPGFGHVYSKPYNIRSIHPANPDASRDWNIYAGLGIGQRIYQEAHRLEPGVRWRSSGSSSYSSALRAKLHAVDPYIWASGSCQWCNTKSEQTGIFSWDQAGQEFFTDHPQQKPGSQG